MFQIRFVFVVAIVGAVLRFELRLHAVGGLSRRPRGLEEGELQVVGDELATAQAVDGLRPEHEMPGPQICGPGIIAAALNTTRPGAA